MGNNRIISLADAVNSADAVSINFLQTGTYSISGGTF
jgi:hypothetical protein